MDAGDAGVGDEGAEHLGGVDGAAGAGYGEGDVAGLGHGLIISDANPTRWGVPPRGGWF